MKLHSALLSTIYALLFPALCHAAPEKPNIIVYFSDDISAREFPLYKSNTWTDPQKQDTRDPKYLASTPVMDRLAEEGCWVRTAWAATVCSPSRAMMMTGRYAHLHKWWHNGDKGEYIDESGKRTTWPLYESSPLQLGHLAQQAGYGTYWAGKTQMAGDLMRYGYDEGCFTPRNLADTDNPYTDFKLVYKKEKGKPKELLNVDTGKPVDTYLQHGWYWYPHVRLMNDPAAPGTMSWWPNSPESEKSFGLNTYGPDVELDFAFDFMERQQKAGKPFFIYHTTHLGHGAFDWFHPEKNGQCWTGTPVIKWDGEKYIRTEPNVTGENGKYETNGTVTETGIHTHINYIDYQIWNYLNKLKEMGLEKDTILIITSDNGTGGYGKGSPDRQKGTHVPFILYAPGIESTKRGEQDILLNLSDVLPTLAEVMGAQIPDDYEVNGTSFWPWFTTDQKEHRDWIYGYRKDGQLIRGKKVMKDAKDKWWDVENEPADLISFPEITDWKKVSDAHRAERDKLKAILPRYDLHASEHDSPAVSTTTPDSRSVIFEDNFEGRTDLGKEYTVARAGDGAFTIKNGFLKGKQTESDHGAVLRKEIDFDDIDIAFDFRFSGGSRFNIVIDDKKEKSVHAGHICRVSISPKRISIGDDKLGSMNLKIREQRKSKNLTPEETAELEAFLQTKQSSAAVNLNKGQWYQCRIRITGDLMETFIDGEPVTKLKSAGIDHATKTKLGVTVVGSTIDFDNLKVYQSNPRK